MQAKNIDWQMYVRQAQAGLTIQAFAALLLGTGLFSVYLYNGYLAAIGIPQYPSNTVLMLVWFGFHVGSFFLPIIFYVRISTLLIEKTQQRIGAVRTARIEQAAQNVQPFTLKNNLSAWDWLRLAKFHEELDNTSTQELKERLENAGIFNAYNKFRYKGLNNEDSLMLAVWQSRQNKDEALQQAAQEDYERERVNATAAANLELRRQAEQKKTAAEIELETIQQQAEIALLAKAYREGLSRVVDKPPQNEAERTQLREHYRALLQIAQRAIEHLSKETAGFKSVVAGERDSQRSLPLIEAEDAAKQATKELEALEEIYIAPTEPERFEDKVLTNLMGLARLYLRGLEVVRVSLTLPSGAYLFTTIDRGHNTQNAEGITIDGKPIELRFTPPIERGELRITSENGTERITLD